MTRALIHYERKFVTFEESLLLGEAARRMDFATYHDIVMTATFRSMGIPARLCQDDAAGNYASARLVSVTSSAKAEE